MLPRFHSTMKNIFLLLLLLPTLGLAKSKPDTLWTRFVDHAAIARAVQAWDGMPLTEQSSLGAIDTLSCLTPEALCASPDGGVVMAATFTRNSDTTKTIVVYKTDEAGEPQWTKFYRRGRSSWAADLQPARDGGYLLVGTMESLTPGLTQVWILRLNTEGDTLWTRMYRAHHYNFARRIRELPHGGFVVGLTAYVDRVASPGTMNIITYDSAGTPQWGSTYRDSFSLALNELMVTQSGNFLLLGCKPGTTPACVVYADGYTGVVIWQKTFSSWASIASACETKGRDFLWLGHVWNQTDLPVPSLMRIDRNGDSLECHLFENSDLSYMIELDDRRLAASGSGDCGASGAGCWTGIIDFSGKIRDSCLLCGRGSIDFPPEIEPYGWPQDSSRKYHRGMQICKTRDGGLAVADRISQDTSQWHDLPFPEGDVCMIPFDVLLIKCSPKFAR